jgi:hypothetical protein
MSAQDRGLSILTANLLIFLLHCPQAAWQRSPHEFASLPHLMSADGGGDIKWQLGKRAACRCAFALTSSVVQNVCFVLEPAVLLTCRPW